MAMRICEYKGCTDLGVFHIPSPERMALSIRVCAVHRAVWAESLQRRDSWPCAVQGCVRPARQDGLCEPCWVAVRGHDALLRERGETDFVLRQLAVRHVMRPIVPDGPTPEDVETAASLVARLRQIKLSLAEMTTKLPAELGPDHDAAKLTVSELLARTEALARVETPQVAGSKQGGLF